MKRFIRRLPILTPHGWFLFFTLMLVPFMLGFVGGYHFNHRIIVIQSKTNGMEHTTNWQQLHKTERVVDGNGSAEIPN